MTRMPEWLRKKLPTEIDKTIPNLLDELSLHTVCSSAYCPNKFECYQRKCATFLLMGDRCTRNCGFCAVSHDSPQPLDDHEPARVAYAIKHLQLIHVVITSVTRDDLPDGGAEHFAKTIAAIRQASPSVGIEVLVPDFSGNQSSWDIIIDAKPNVLNHNIETVPELYSRVRPEAIYERSLEFLSYVKKTDDSLLTKSGMMVGLGEKLDSVISSGRDLRNAGVDMITVGQYLRPTDSNLPVERYVTPEEFAWLRDELKELGFLNVAASPFVRSSYNAGEAYESLE